MSEIDFTTRFKSNEMSGLALPVEIRKPNFALQASGLSTDTIRDVAPGTYFVTARLPGGQEISRRIDVTEGRNQVLLTPDAEDESPGENHEVGLFLGKKASQAYDDEFLKDLGKSLSEVRQDEGMERLGPSEERFGLRLFRSHGLQREELDLFTLQTAINLNALPEAGIRITPREPGVVYTLQLLQSNQPPTNCLLPIGYNRSGIPVGCILLPRFLADGALALDIHLQNVDADAMVQFRERGNLAQVANAITSATNLDSNNAKNLIYEKMDDPIGAMIGFYVLLRLNHLELLQERWIINLSQLFPWLPDGSAIRGEYLARSGRHAEALDSFLELATRGLPILSAGMSYTLDRLRMYATVYDSGLDPGKQQQAKLLMTKLCDTSNFVDFPRTYLTFTGVDPNVPDAKSTRDLVPLSKQPHAMLDITTSIAGIIA